MITLSGSCDATAILFSRPPLIRFVLMVIDALRHDFLTIHNFPFTKSHSMNAHRIEYIAQTQTPTVTMPRLKVLHVQFMRDYLQAITSGTVPSFADVLLNFAATAVGGDHWLRALGSDRHRRVLFYGDDTWLRLFPETFDVRSEGTTSFFVAD
jgi:ethanolaminephosphotransferase